MKQKENKTKCTGCQTGYDSLRLDARSPFCWFIACFKNGKCSMYKPMNNVDRII